MNCAKSILVELSRNNLCRGHSFDSNVPGQPRHSASTDENGYGYQKRFSIPSPLDHCDCSLMFDLGTHDLTIRKFSAPDASTDVLGTFAEMVDL
jgi:hypothetical protein